MPAPFPHRHLLGIEGLSASDILSILDAAEPWIAFNRGARKADGAAAEVAALMDCPVINAGDGRGEHPTQALLDALTIRRRLGRIEGAIVAICGDIRHSRVANSNMRALPLLGAEVRVVAPPALMPDEPPPGVAAYDSLDEGIA